MIVCVTLNPCLDRTLTVGAWQPGDLVRGGTLREVAGGKGNNVARALSRLGRPAVPATFLGGELGARCEVLLRGEDHLNPVVIATASTTRAILTVHTRGTPLQTAFFDPDPEITEIEAHMLARVVEKMLDGRRARALTLSGSSPAVATHELYRDMIALAHAHEVPVFLDTYGPALDAVRGPWPTVIKINRREASIFLMRPAPTDQDLWRLLETWAGQGVKASLVTDGANPVLVMHGGTAYRAIPPAIQPVNPIGSGDCLLAGLVDGWLRELEPEAWIRRGVAAAVANALVWDSGAIDADSVARLEAGVKVEKC